MSSIVIGPSSPAQIGTEFVHTEPWKYITLNNINVSAVTTIPKSSQTITILPPDYTIGSTIISQQATFVPNSKTVSQINSTISFDVIVQVKYNDGKVDKTYSEVINVTSNIIIPPNSITNPNIQSSFAPNAIAESALPTNTGIKVTLTFDDIDVFINGQANVNVVLAG